MTAIDESVRQLELLCERLRDTTPAVEAGTAEMEKVAHALSDTEQHLSLSCDQLATEVDGIQKEAETTENAAAKACHELGQACEEAKTSTLGELEKAAEEAEGHWTGTLPAKTTLIANAFTEMESAGWEPLDTVLSTEKDDFERWTADADTSLAALATELQSVATALEHHGTDAETAAHDLTEAPAAKDSFWQQIETEGHHVANETAAHFADQMAQPTADLERVFEEITTAAGQGSDHVRAQIDTVLQKETDAVEAHSTGMREQLEKTVEALGRAETEFERGTAQAETAETVAQGVMELAGQVFDAKQKLQVIHEVTEALGQ